MFDIVLNMLLCFIHLVQRRAEGTSSVACEILIINCKKKFSKFVHLQLFNVKYKFAHLQLFDVKFLFSEKHTLRKQKRTAVCGRALVFLDFKLTQENDEKLSLGHK